MTSETDVKSNRSRIPGAQFLVNSRSSQAQANDSDPEDEMWGDEWVLIDNGKREKEKQQFTPAEIDNAIKRETMTMQQSKATCILVSPKN